MEDVITREEIRNRLAIHYRGVYDSWHFLMDEATAAIHDGDEEAHKAITRRADKKSDFMDGIKSAAEVLDIKQGEFMEAVNADRVGEQ